MIIPDAFDQKRTGTLTARLRTGILGLLLVAGLTLWGWRFVRLTQDERPTQPADHAPSLPPETATVDAQPHFDVDMPAGDWQPLQSTAARDMSSRSPDPLVRSAEVVAIESNPFGIDQAEFQTSSPVTAAASSEHPANITYAAVPTASADDPGSPPAVVLQSTIIGESRRAALINNKLYREGSMIRVQDKTFRLLAVSPGCVVLERAGERTELRVPRIEPSTDTRPAK